MDGDILELLMQADPGLEGRAVQNALRKRAALGAFIEGAGGQTLGPIGSRMVQSAERGQAGQREAVLRLAVAQMRAKNPRPAQPSSLGRLISERDALPPDSPLRATYDEAIKMATTRNPGQPSFTPLQTGEGYISYDRRTGRVAPVKVGDKPAVPPAADPALQEDLAAGKARGKVAGESAGQATADLPKVEDQAGETLKLVDELLVHPGLKRAVGFSSYAPRPAGTDARDFEIRLNQLRGKQFLEAFNSLKGGGHITEIEGQKATEAMARMDLSASEKEFVRAARDFQALIRAGVERAKKRASQGRGATPAADPLGIR